MLQDTQQNSVQHEQSTKSSEGVSFILTRSALEGRSYPMISLYKILGGGFPGGAVVKNPPANAGDTGSSPGPGRSHMPRSN